MGGFELFAGRFFSEVDVLWTKPSASQDATPRIDVETDIWAVTLKGGYRVYKGLGVTAGGRRLSLDLDTTIEFPRSGVRLHGSHTRAVWSPFVGADWRGDLTRKGRSISPPTSASIPAMIRTRGVARAPTGA